MCQEQGEDLKLKHGRAIPGCTPGKLDFSSGTVTLLNTCMWSSSLSEEPRQLDKPSLKGMVMYISFLCPWDFPGKNTGVGCHFLLQGIFLTQGLNPCLLHWQADSLPLSHLGSPGPDYPTSESPPRPPPLGQLPFSIAFFLHKNCCASTIPTKRY